MSKDEDFFAGFDACVRRLVAGAADSARRLEIAPSDFSAVVATALIGRAFDLLTVVVPVEKAVEIISLQAKMRASDALFGDKAGSA